MPLFQHLLLEAAVSSMSAQLVAPPLLHLCCLPGAQNGAGPYNYDAVKRWTLPRVLTAYGQVTSYTASRRVRMLIIGVHVAVQACECVLQCDLLLFPLNVDLVHWVMVAVDLVQHRLLYWDSQHNVMLLHACGVILRVTAGGSTFMQAGDKPVLRHVAQWLVDEANTKLSSSPAAHATGWPCLVLATIAFSPCVSLAMLYSWLLVLGCGLKCCGLLSSRGMITPFAMQHIGYTRCLALQTPRVPQQSNSSDCGPFSIAFADSASVGRSVICTHHAVCWASDSACLTAGPMLWATLTIQRSCGAAFWTTSFICVGPMVRSPALFALMHTEVMPPLLCAEEMPVQAITGAQHVALRVSKASPVWFQIHADSSDDESEMQEVSVQPVPKKPKLVTCESDGPPHCIICCMALLNTQPHLQPLLMRSKKTFYRWGKRGIPICGIAQLRAPHVVACSF
jgi:hypothetical protein